MSSDLRGKCVWRSSPHLATARQTASQAVPLFSPAVMMATGVPETAIWPQTQSQNTYEDAYYSAQMLKEKQITEVILVTSAMHMPRAKALFEKQGIAVIAAPTDYTITQQNWDSVFHPSLGEGVINLLPNSGALGLTTNVLKEYLGMLIYSLRGWL